MPIGDTSCDNFECPGLVPTFTKSRMRRYCKKYFSPCPVPCFYDNFSGMTHTEPRSFSSPKHRRKLAVGLFFLAPLVGEFLLGNLSITWLWTLFTLAPLYGGGALLIRETVRRTGRGWPSIVLLGLAYAILEETFVTQSLFNPDYVGLRLLDFGYLPGLGIGAWWTVFVLGIHMVWSTTVPIALVESFSPHTPQQPWLEIPGLVTTVLLFTAGCIVTALAQPPNPTGTSVTQFIWSGIAIIAIVALAFRLGKRSTQPQNHPPARRSPPPLTIGLAALIAGSLFMSLARVHDALPAAANVGGMLLILAAGGIATLYVSHTAGWSARHRLAVAAGLLLTYVWYGFVQVPSVGDTPPAVDLAGNIIFSLGAIALLIAASRRVSRAETFV